MSVLDLDLARLASVRVIGDPRDHDVVMRQIGPLRGTIVGEPDIIVEFVDELPLGRLTMMGRNEWAYDDQGLVILRGKQKSSIRVRLPLEDAGTGCRIVVERGAPAVPYLVALVNLAVLGNGGIALHAAAFEHHGTGVVVTGWSKGGKTESLLAALSIGARYVGDEWLYLGVDGTTASGVPEPVRVWGWYVDQLDGLAARVSGRDRARLRALALATRSTSVAEGVSVRAFRNIARRVGHLLDEQRHVDLPVDRLVDGERRVGTMPIDAVVHAVSTDDDATFLEPANGGDIAARMAASLAFERLPLTSLYHAFRYAFPNRCNPLIETAEQIERKRLESFLSDKRSWLLSHPYPPDLQLLRNALSPLWDRTG